MALRLQITSEHQDLVGDDVVREFADAGGSIGRSLRNDWILPDPDRYISGRHATIDYRSGMYYLADLSTNGVYINDEKEAVGRGNPRRLYDGDRLRMGDFEISVSIDDDGSLEIPDEDPSTLVKDKVEQLVAEDSPETGEQMLDAEEITGGDAFHSTLFDTSTEKTSTERSINTPETKAKAQTNSQAKAKSKPPEAPLAVSAKQSEAKKPLKTPTRVETTSNDLFDVFLDGLGLDRSELHPSVDPAEVMKNAGQVMREFVSGMSRLLVSRANLKTAFALDQTTVLPRHNNPLKLSQNSADSIKQLLVGHAGEYLGPRDAVREVCRDLLFHQDAFLGAMTSAFGAFADRFDPEELAAAFESDSESKSMLGFMNKSKYWQLYCEHYPAMTARSQGRFPSAFSQAFVKAYERQIADLLRLNPQEPATSKPARTPAAAPSANNEDDIDLKATVNDHRSTVFDTGSMAGRAAR